MVSPLEYVLGWKSPSELDWLPQGGKAELSLLAVDSSLAPRGAGRGDAGNPGSELDEESHPG